MIVLASRVQLIESSSLVPSETTFLAAVLTFGTIAVVIRSVSWLSTTQIDRLVLGAAYVVGVVGFVFTGDPALVFAPPTATLAWLFVGKYVDGGQRQVRRSRRTREAPEAAPGVPTTRTRLVLPLRTWTPIHRATTSATSLGWTPSRRRSTTG